MKCVICYGEEIVVQEVKEDFIMGNNVIYVPVKVPVCKNCGERYYDRRTIKYLEEVEDKLHHDQAKLKEVGKVLLYD